MSKDTMDEKIELVKSILQHNVDLINFADTKAGLILGSAGIIMGLLVFSEKINLDKYLIFGLITTIGFLSATIFFSFLVIFPRITQKTQFESIIFYKSITQQTKEEYRKRVQMMTVENILQDFLDNIYSIADIQSEKFRYLRIALICMIISVISLSGTLICHFFNN